MKSYFLLFFLVCNLTYTQNDTLMFGKVKSVREKLYFLDSIRQNAKLFSSDDEFGHMGFVSPEATIRRFNFLWIRSAASHFVNHYRQYDKNGLVQIDNWFNKDNSVRNKYRYEYDEYQNRISEISTRNDTSFYRENAYYDYDCRLLSTSAFSSVMPNPYHYSVYAYDDNDRLTEIQRYDHEGRNSGSRFVYDKTGKVIREIRYTPYVTKDLGNGSSVTMKDGKGREYRYREYAYNDDGKKTEERWCSETDTIISHRQIFTYDKKNRLIRKDYATDRITATEHFEYKNNLLHTFRKETYGHPEWSETIEYAYNAKGLVSRAKFTSNGKTAICEFKYTFDHKNNWIEQTKTVNGKPLYLRKRTITYYD